ncbi:lactadherin-like [Lytechinus variegatus]|uniref:lactadherin-like n=1 Tax=Lytechinus variegatus TaxID=7654 RepID=UPI001BB15CC1|nr:lactadherin-like [Lytechinus variegatus]
MATRPLGMEDRSIADSQLSASSCWNTIQCASTARLFNEYQAWSPKKNDKKPWIQVDLRQSFRLEAVLTQGRDNAENWVTSFLVPYSLDGYSWTYSLGNDGQPQVFNSNQDRNSLVVNPFRPAFVARFVRIEPLSWHHHVSLRFELFGAGPIPVVPNTLGLEDYRIPDSELYASSCYHDRNCAKYARLNFAGDEQGENSRYSVTSSEKLPGAWIPRFDDHNQWVGVDLVDKYRVVGVITQGRQDADQWVTSFAVSHSMDGKLWSFIQDCGHEEKIYQGNHDRATPIINVFETPLTARAVRVHPKRWTRHIALRLELLGNGPVAEVGVDENKLGLESGRIPDSSLAASSCISDDAYCSESARLNHEVGGWVPRINDLAQWIQVDLMAVYRLTGVITQGRSDAAHWVTRYTVWTSQESRGNWIPVTESTCGEAKEIKIFTGNCDQFSHFTNRFNPPILARYVLLAPVAWHDHIGLRFELLGEGPFMLPDVAVH